VKVAGRHIARAWLMNGVLKKLEKLVVKVVKTPVEVAAVVTPETRIIWIETLMNALYFFI
jgi:cystathionine beta-lyase/cystathionine gamma-synthase